MNSARYIHTFTQVFTYLNQTSVFLMDFQKRLNITFNENPTNGSCVVTCEHIDERMYGHTHNEAISRVSQFFFSKFTVTKCSFTVFIVFHPCLELE